MEDEHTTTTSPDKVIRKLRKKLRQIDNLEVLERELNEEEIYKVNQKLSIRKELRALLRQHHPDELDIMKRPGIVQTQSENDVKKAKRSSSPKSSHSIVSEAPHSATTQQESHRLSQGDSPTTLKETKVKPKSSRECVQNQRDNETHTGKCMWRDGCFEVVTLQGHNDLVLSVDCFQDYILSASRDTTVRVWRVGKTEEERSLRGHTGSVTDVSFIPSSLAVAIITKLEADINENCSSPQQRLSVDSTMLAVSGGLDCTLKVWNIISGESLASIYTYNGITCLGCGSWGVITGTEGGRLELWSLTSQQRITFLDVFDTQVTALHVKKNQVYAGSRGGDVAVCQIDINRKILSIKYMLERDSLPSMSVREFSTLVEHKDKCYLGDGGPNVKVLDWKKNQVSRLKNHRGDVGMTDSLSITQDGCLLATSFLVDSGSPSINIRNLESGEYICSLLDEDEGRYLTLSASSNIIVAAGHNLKVWIHKEESMVPENGATNGSHKIVLPVFFPNLSSNAIDSEEDTDWASSCSEDEGGSQNVFGKKRNQEDGNTYWWCSIL